MGKVCLCCKGGFTSHPRPGQHYCGKVDCQRERRRLYHQQKMNTDPEYRQGQADCQKSWQERNPGYWRQYRADHPDYTERNRQQQRERNRRRSPPFDDKIAKMDATSSCNQIETGKYILSPLHDGVIAKMDATVVQLVVIPSKDVVETRAGP